MSSRVVFRPSFHRRMPSMTSSIPSSISLSLCFHYYIFWISISVGPLLYPGFDWNLPVFGPYSSCCLFSVNVSSLLFLKSFFSMSAVLSIRSCSSRVWVVSFSMISYLTVWAAGYIIRIIRLSLFLMPQIPSFSRAGCRSPLFFTWSPNWSAEHLLSVATSIPIYFWWSKSSCQCCPWWWETCHDC